MKKFIIIFVLSTFFAAIDAISQSPQNSNIVYVTNTIERPIYLEKLVIVTNIVEKIIKDNGIKPVYNKTIQKKYPNQRKNDLTAARVCSYVLMCLFFVGAFGILLYYGTAEETY